jgi:N-acetylglucosamine-6-phosphate deacetylase
MSACAFTNTTLWLGDGDAFAGHLLVADGRITAVARGPYAGPLPTVDLHGLALSPGLIDLMVLGAFNRSILHDSPLEIAAEYLRLGVTACQFCIGTLSWEAMGRIAANIRAAQQSPRADAARVLGLYLEGPFQQPELTGASQRQFALPPDPAHVERILSEFGAAISQVNVAPGLPGDAAAVRRLTAAGKTVSMAHSNAAAEPVQACVEAGTSVLGHVWDNNSGRIGDSGVQQPTIEHVALTDERVRFVHLICDGSHVHPILVRLVQRCRGTAAICLVTDAVIRAGCPDGPFHWDDGRLFHKANGVGRTDQGWLCGSALLLPDMLRNFVKFTGLPPAEAIRTVTWNPACSLGLGQERGILQPGAVADLVAWDDRLRVRRVWRGGQEIAPLSDYAEITL